MLPVLSGFAGGIMLISLIGITFPGSGASEDQGIWMAYHHKQCQDLPWVTIYDSRVMLYDDNEGYLNAVSFGAAEYYELLGIKVYDHAATNSGIVPAMCGHDSALIVYLQVSSANVLRMQVIGFERENLPID